MRFRDAFQVAGQQFRLFLRSAPRRHVVDHRVQIEQKLFQLAFSRRGGKEAQSVITQSTRVAVVAVVHENHLADRVRVFRLHHIQVQFPGCGVHDVREFLCHVLFGPAAVFQKARLAQLGDLRNVDLVPIHTIHQDVRLPEGFTHELTGRQNTKGCQQNRDPGDGREPFWLPDEQKEQQDQHSGGPGSRAENDIQSGGAKHRHARGVGKDRSRPGRADHCQRDSRQNVTDRTANHQRFEFRVLTRENRGVEEDVRRSEKQRRARAGDRLRQKLRVKETGPEGGPLRPGLRQFRPFARVEHECRDPSDQDETDPRRQRVDPPHDRVIAGGKAVPQVVEEERRSQFQNEKDPLRSPAEDERPDERFGRQRRGQCDGPPDPDPGDGSENNR